MLIGVLKIFKSGSLNVKSGSADLVKVSAAKDEITVDLQNLEVAKEILTPFRKLGVVTPGAEEKSILEKLKMVKGFAETLKEEGMTISVRRMGEQVLVVGERAKPGLSRLVLGSSIQVDVMKIISLMRALR
jgi:hypothetical protein